MTYQLSVMKAQGQLCTSTDRQLVCLCPFSNFNPVRDFVFARDRQYT